MIGPAVIAVLAGGIGGWIFRELLIKNLRTRHPQIFTELGEPTSRQLSTIIPRYQEQQIRFWKFIWGGKAFQVKDRDVTLFAMGILVSNTLLGFGVVTLLWLVATSPRS